ncbi:hypothetical protein HHK36_015410 [Tetracentron sinense]|uniref:Aspartate/glutamate/uridylate kinase domain-containing protein n=1 Tax=Tetracentron sinense TaxID=13715 RepID=A0A835DCS7_TETSI|nr:hypothetical protein HHK36_015410 [Tetracentron sinense]
MNQEEKQNISNITFSPNSNRPLRCIVKLGGAAITCKNEIEKINEENLGITSSQLRQAMMSSSSSSVKVLGMDWSKRAGISEISATVDDFRDQPFLDANSFIIVHGAGSFGHFQASRSGVHRGGLNLPLVKAGFVATRISVTSLNLEVVRALARGSYRESLAIQITQVADFRENLPDGHASAAASSTFWFTGRRLERRVWHPVLARLVWPSMTIDGHRCTYHVSVHSLPNILVTFATGCITRESLQKVQSDGIGRYAEVTSIKCQDSAFGEFGTLVGIMDRLLITSSYEPVSLLT